MISKIIVAIIEKIKNLYYKIYFKGKVGIIPPKLKILGQIYIFNSNVEIGRNVTLYPGVTFAGEGKIKIANNCKIGQNVIIHAGLSGGVTIDQDTIIAAQTYIIDSNHSIDKNSLIRLQKLNSDKLYIGPDVWIGANATIIKGAQIQQGSVIGAKALVNGETKDYSINVGIPYRDIGKRM